MTVEKKELKSPGRPTEEEIMSATTTAGSKEWAAEALRVEQAARLRDDVMGGVPASTLAKRIGADLVTTRRGLEKAERAGLVWSVVLRCEGRGRRNTRQTFKTKFYHHGPRPSLRRAAEENGR